MIDNSSTGLTWCEAVYELFGEDISGGFQPTVHGNLPSLLEKIVSYFLVQ